MYDSPVDKKPIVAASYSLSEIGPLASVFFSYVVFYQLKYSFKVFKSHSQIVFIIITTFLFCLFFFDLFFSEISVIITAAAVCSWVIFLKLLKTEYSDNVNAMKIWKLIVSHTSCIIQIIWSRTFTNFFFLFASMIAL